MKAIKTKRTYTKRVKQVEEKGFQWLSSFGVLIILGLILAGVVFLQPKGVGLKYAAVTPSPKVTLTPQQCKELQSKPVSLPAECRACFQ